MEHAQGSFELQNEEGADENSAIRPPEGPRYRSDLFRTLPVLNRRGFLEPVGIILDVELKSIGGVIQISYVATE